MTNKDFKLTKLLKTLKQDEFSKLKKYVNSPYFNNSYQITRLFEILEQQYPSFNNIDKHEIFRSIHPKEKYKDKKLRDLFSRMNELVENFLGQLKFDEKEGLSNTFKLKQLAKKGLQKHFISVYKETDRKLENQPYRGSEYLFTKFNIFSAKKDFLHSLEKGQKRIPFFDDITNEIELFTNFSINKFLELWLVIYSQQLEISHSYEFKILGKIIDYLNENPVIEYPVINILYKLKLLELDEDNENIYFEIKDLLFKNLHTIELEQKRVIFVNLFNYTKLQSIKSKPVFRRENYEILKHSIKNGLYPKDGEYFSESSYITVSATALMQKDFQWALQFLEDHKELLNPKVRENAYIYCKAVYDYRMGDYGSALRKLARVTLDDFHYHMRVKIHQLKINYESGDYESAKNTIDSFRHFLHSTKLLPEFIKIRLINFVNFTSRVINVQLTGDPRNLSQIEKEIRETEPVKLENKIWLLEQISRLKEKKIR